MKKPQQSITSLPASPDDERRARIRKYSITMTIRLVCFALVFVLPGWWQLVAIVGAVILPYIAVVVANTGSSRAGDVTVMRPGAIVPVRPTVPTEHDT
ncbi:DUF3099 domain-containing protein [Glaciihabitans sp. dw_435]|uniref:DUF3099 domain-containing protein n=1 Tax=Glaciihabitans sp. dw_435 TaxID=2720081 RepID=UPI001BD57E36|nr:DUF3099 domain-containing protein [Glaciihabitans sp. dw_435]